MSTFTTSGKKQTQPKGADIIRSVRMFFGIPTRPAYRNSRIIRRPTKTYEEFEFKGYDIESSVRNAGHPDKIIKLIFKN